MFKLESFSIMIVLTMGFNNNISDNFLVHKRYVRHAATFLIFPICYKLAEACCRI